MEKRTLRDYLNELRECNDEDRLKKELKIYDNWPVLLFGNQDELFLKVTSAFKNSPQEEGINEPWEAIPTRRTESYQRFNYVYGTVEVQMKKSVHNQYKWDNDKINGLVHSVWVMFHPYQKKKIENVKKFKAIALAIIGFCEYVIKENLTARFPKYGLDLNHIPENC